MIKTTIASVCLLGSIALGGLNGEEPPSQGGTNVRINLSIPRVVSTDRVINIVRPGQSRNEIIELERSRRGRDQLVREISRAENKYAYGYCTWYVKNKSASAQNGWGNARDWPVNSTEPIKGGVAKLKSPDPRGHVAYVEEVKENQIIISEMNYLAWNKVNYRTLNKNDRSIIGYYN
jgi:hypothetical protein